MRKKCDDFFDDFAWQGVCHKAAKPLEILHSSLHYECEGWGFESLMAHHLESPEIATVSGLFIALIFYILCKKNRKNSAIWCYLVCHFV